MKKSRIIGALSAVIFSFITMSTHAALVGVLPVTPGGANYQAYYDDVADLTWLANASASGSVIWATANTWAAGLDIDGVTGWRLPDTLVPDASCDSSTTLSFGKSCTGSELGNLFYNVLGGVAGTSIATTHNSEYDKFTGVVPDRNWSDTPIGQSAYFFDLGDGSQSSTSVGFTNIGWAVRTGSPAEVPIPAAVWLFGSGLLGLVGAARRKVRV
jgi:hypothetical protein